MQLTENYEGAWISMKINYLINEFWFWKRRRKKKKVCFYCHNFYSCSSCIVSFL